MKYDDELVSLLDLELPVSQPRKVGFLEITGQEYKENVNTRVYAHFLDRAANPLLADLFVSSLLELIRQRSNRTLSLSDYTCETEVVTKDNLRIDLLLCDEAGKSAIIVENKLYHSLENDLTAYYNHLDFDNKLGVLLTLNPVKIPHENSLMFVNILHKEWIDAIKQIGLPTGLPVQTYVYLNDFFETVMNLTKNTKMNDQAIFSFSIQGKF